MTIILMRSSKIISQLIWKEMANWTLMTKRNRKMRKKRKVPRKRTMKPIREENKKKKIKKCYLKYFHLI
jgi:hypothetical protein